MKLPTAKGQRRGEVDGREAAGGAYCKERRGCGQGGHPEHVCAQGGPRRCLNQRRDKDQLDAGVGPEAAI